MHESRLAYYPVHVSDLTLHLNRLHKTPLSIVDIHTLDPNYTLGMDP